MKKKIIIVATAVLAAIPAGIVSATPAAACDRYPCYGSCHVNRDYITVDESGTITIGNRPIECYY